MNVRVLTCLGLSFFSFAAAAANPPRPLHVVVVIEENKSLMSIHGAEAVPYINRLANEGALFTPVCLESSVRWPVASVCR